MKTYILSATAVVFLSVILSFVLPEGKLGKTIRMTLQMVCIAFLIQPVLSLFSVDVTEAQQELCDYQTICRVYAKEQAEALQEGIWEAVGVSCVCEVEITYDGENFVEESVVVTMDEENDELRQKICAYLQDNGYIHSTVNVKNS
jgi:hypothetical protein